MAHYTDIPFVNPFKFLRDTEPQGVHLDEAWASAQRRSFQLRAHYLQKWVKTDTTQLYLESTIAPQPLRVIGVDGQVKKSIPWTVAFSATSYAGYKLTFDISDLAEGKYFLTQQVTLSQIDWRWISEPIHSKAAWPETVLLRYKNSFNTAGVAFTAGVEFAFRVEADMPPQDLTPRRERTTAVSQTRNVKTLSATPYRTFVLRVGQAPASGHFVGVAPWVMDLLNRIFCLDYVTLNGKRVETNTDAEWETLAQKGWPLIGGDIELVEAFNNDSASLGTVDGQTLVPGLVTAYNIETSFFGAGSSIPVTDVEPQA